MATTRQIAANRTNARRSTGPRTAGGKTRAGMNALKHGLSTPSSSLPNFFDHVAQLADAIAGPGQTDPAIWAAASAVASAEFDVRRTRDAHRATMARLLSEDSTVSNGDSVLDEIWRQHAALDRYEQRALSRRKAAIRTFDRLRSSNPAANCGGDKDLDFGRTNPIKDDLG